MLFPNLTKPRFRHAITVAQSVLLELKNPSPPIPVEDYILSKKWKIRYDELHGPDGYMVKVVKNRKTRFMVYLATDEDPESPYDNETIRKRQYFTMAHELGHILLHGRFLLNSHNNMTEVPNEIADIMEVEAHWFASRLLMPNYAFQRITDLIPDQLAQKCGVNFTPAMKRLKTLEPNIRNSLIQSMRLDKWPVHEKFELPWYPPEKKFETWKSYEEAAVSSELLYVCKNCGLLHTDHNIWFQYCIECNTELTKANCIV